MNQESRQKLPEDWLEFDPQAEIERITAFIRSEVSRRGAHGVMIGISGGLDSTVCAYLCIRALGVNRVHALMLPERDSDERLHRMGHFVTQVLGLRAREMDLTDLIDHLGLYEGLTREPMGNRKMTDRIMAALRRLSGAPVLFSWMQAYAFGERRGLSTALLRSRLWGYAGQVQAFILGKVRARMLVLSIQAAHLDCLVVCTTDRSEYSIGLYDPHGDGAGDLALLRHLYKTQIRELGRALGVPEEILTQPSSADLLAGLPNENAIGLRYEWLDRILAGISMRLDDEAIAGRLDLRAKQVAEVRAACALADARRGFPVALQPPDAPEPAVNMNHR